MSDKYFALGLGIGTTNSSGDWLEVYFPQPMLRPSAAAAAALQQSLAVSDQQAVIELQAEQLSGLESALRGAGESGQADIVKALKTSSQRAVAVLLAEDQAPASVAEAYLKLHLLSHRLVKPHEVDLGGLFAVLPNVAWTNQGAIDLADLPERQWQARLNGEPVAVNCVDKFPRMTDYVLPEGVRIAHTARVRLGAYLGNYFSARLI